MSMISFGIAARLQQEFIVVAWMMLALVAIAGVSGVTFKLLEGSSFSCA